MPAVVPEERARVLAVVRALKAVGVRVRNWKNFVHGERTPERSPVQDSERRFSFGRDLQLLPQQRVEEVNGSVPLFLVEACGYLSRHLHTEGLFRKTGSLGRIRTLRSELENGERIFLPPRDALLQPCDVASLLKQFLRELPAPLIALDLQAALCQAQTLEEGARERATLLLTSLLTPVQTRTLQYSCTFLRDVALRCDENRMEVGSLALVMAPNLLSCSAQTCRLTVHTEKQLEQQTAAIRSLILHAERIGVVPSSILETLGTLELSESNSPAEGAVVTRRSRLSVYSNMSRQRRRSVGEIFVDAFSKLRPGRTPTGPPLSLDVSSGHLISRSPAPQSPSTVKRKASEEPVPEADGSAKKRRSLHDLRADAQSISSQSADESTGNPSPPAVKISADESFLALPKRRNLQPSHRKSLRPPKQEERLHLKRRSLRFFSMSSGGASPALGITPPDKPVRDQSFCGGSHEEKTSLLNSDSKSSLKIPFILIEEPGRVVIGSEVDDDPDLLNCSFVESPDHALTDHTLTDHALNVHTKETIPDLQNLELEAASDDDRWVLLEDGNLEVLVEYDEAQTETQRPDVGSPEAAEEVRADEVKEEPKKRRSGSKKRSGPRRSMSMPEVALDVCLDDEDRASPQEEVGAHQVPFGGDFWSVSVSLPVKKKQKEVRRRRCGTLHQPKTGKDSALDSEGSIKKTSSRFSVAERFRSFGALASFLRTPTVRLRRQGARRFSRSFSDEGVQEEQQAFLELTDSEEPQISRSPSPSPCSSEDLTLLGSAQKSDQDQSLRGSNPRPEVVTEVPIIEIFDLDKVFKQQCSLAEELEFNTAGDQQRASLTPSIDSNVDVRFDVSTPSGQQRAAYASTDSICTDTDAVSPQLSLYGASPPGVCKPLDCLSFDGVFSISSVSEKCSLSLDLSPPAFHFRPQASRRRYRDSPRWPAHDVRMSAWEPLPY
ncbi:uncharacterized protein zgc:153345 [Trichomycterus rosablanca]|uniref:uncharacterized protein zgc:153345 n=1 Tax=Trichomycterus rosablanca TaxID=2290929 RepID=UPI002F35CB44